MNIGHNTPSAAQLLGYVTRLERIEAEKKALSEDAKLVKQEAKSAGFDVATITTVLKRRKMKPHDLQEAETLLDLYLHALGMAVEPPLFRAAGLAAIDITAREQVIERMKDFVPAAGMGHITVTWQGKQLQLTRDKDGAVNVVEVAEQKQPPTESRRSAPVIKEPAPEVDEDGAEALGRQYAKDNRPVIDNPFPFGDERRARFDLGWRKEAGSDGMGPDE